MRRTAVAIVCSALALSGAVAVKVSAEATPPGDSVSTAARATRPAKAPRSVMYVGNNWAGTANVLDARTFAKVGRINVVPDYQQRMAEIRSDPQRLAYFTVIREQIGEGHDQLVDDMFSTPDGTILAVSRPSFADVVGINLRTRKVVWRFAMHGQRSDHMAVNPRGTRLLVSDSTEGHVDELEPPDRQAAAPVPVG